MKETEPSGNSLLGERQMHGPNESKKILLEQISTTGGMSFSEALEFEERDEIWFGPETSVLDVLAKKQALGFVEFNKKNRKYKLSKPRKQPIYE